MMHQLTSTVMVQRTSRVAEMRVISTVQGMGAGKCRAKT